MALHKLNEARLDCGAGNAKAHTPGLRIVRLTATARGETMHYRMRDDLEGDLSQFENAFARLTGLENEKR